MSLYVERFADDGDPPTNPTDIPQTEAEVIARLKNKPKGIKVTVTQNGNESPRQWVVLTYDFQDKLKKFGSFLYAIAEDVAQAGGLVESDSRSKPRLRQSPAPRGVERATNRHRRQGYQHIGSHGKSGR